MSITENVLKKIKELRIKNNYKMSVVAAALGYETPKGYYEVESGKIKLNIDHLEKLSLFYGIPVSFFFTEQVTEMVRKGEGRCAS